MAKTAFQTVSTKQQQNAKLLIIQIRAYESAIAAAASYDKGDLPHTKLLIETLATLKVKLKAR